MEGQEGEMSVVTHVDPEQFQVMYDKHKFYLWRLFWLVIMNLHDQLNY